MYALYTVFEFLLIWTKYVMCWDTTCDWQWYL